MDHLKLYGNIDNDIDSLVKLVKIVCGDKGMNFCMDNCAVLKMK